MFVVLVGSFGVMGCVWKGVGVVRWMGHLEDWWAKSKFAVISIPDVFSHVRA